MRELGKSVGIRRLRSVGVAALAAGVAVLGAAPAQSAAGGDGLRMPGASASRGTLGSHHFYPYPVYFSGAAPAALSQADFTEVMSQANSYWSTATGGQITVAKGWDMPTWQKVSITSSQEASCDVDAITKAVRAKVGSAGDRDHLVVILNGLSQCDFGDRPQFGLTRLGDGFTIVNGSFTTGVALRTLARNAGVGFAGSLNCVNGSTPVPISGTCTGNNTSDNPWDPTGSMPYGRAGTPIADTLATLGVLPSDASTQVVPGPARSITLTPLSSGAGLRSAWFDLGSYRYLVDYRVPTGLDAWIDDRTWTSPGGVVADPGGGVTVHRIDMSKPASERARLVVDFHPDASVTSTARHPGLAQGESYANPDGSFAISVTAASSASASISISFPGIDKVDRWSGDDRYSTSATISSGVYGPGVDVAYVASGEIYTDALSGAPVAGRSDGPVLLVSAKGIPDVIATELTRLAPHKIVIFGGPATISPEIEAQLHDFTTGEVQRWSGADRFETSAAISEVSFDPGVATAYVASGRVFTDALSGAPVAGKTDGPVLLVDTDKLPSSITTELQRLKPTKIVVFGGANTITDGVLTQLQALAGTGGVNRWWGPDRFSTSAQIVDKAYKPNGGTVFIASGRVFTDALSGAPAAGTLESPVLLVDTDKLPDTVAAQLQRLRPGKIVVLGGPNTISYGVQASLARYLP